MESSDHDLGVRLEAVRNSLAYASTHLSNVTLRRTLRLFDIPIPIGWNADKTTALECSSAQERINEARKQIEELTALLVPPPRSYDEQTDVFRRALMNNRLVK
jgi:hypothetical protein